MEQAEGFEEQGPNGEKLVCLLKKAVYGLKQAPHKWHKLINEFMESQNLLRQLLTDPGACIIEDGDIIGIVAVYVDDIIVFNTRQKWMQSFKENLGKAFSIKDLGEPAWIMGMSVVRSPEDKTITFHQQSASSSPRSLARPPLPAPRTRPLYSGMLDKVLVPFMLMQLIVRRCTRTSGMNSSINK